MPKPDKLPDEVDWISNTAGNMTDVLDRSADLIFAGQTVEHLWADELIGFILECGRVIRDGGLLILDSPNEEITHELKWNHPEHTVEFRPDDARRLLEAGGFTVEKNVGHWLCRDDGQFLPLYAATEVEHENRVTAGFARPEDCFSWWIEARLTHRPDAAAVVRCVRDIWSRYGDRRVNRMMRTFSGQVVAKESGNSIAVGAEGWAGYLLFGPYGPLPGGRTVVGVDVDPYEAGVSPGVLEVFHTIGDRQIAVRDLPAFHAGGKVWIDVELEGTVFGVEYRVLTNGAATIAVGVCATVISRNFD